MDEPAVSVLARSFKVRYAESMAGRTLFDDEVAILVGKP